MKLKGINPFEQHIEKVVLGLLSAGALGVVASQFLFEPNKVSIGTGEALPPERAYEPVEKAAEALLAKVRSDSPQTPAEPKVDILQRFEQRLAGNVAPRAEIVAMGPRIALGGAKDVGAKSDGAVAALAVPAPVLPAARAFAGSIDPLEVAQAPELQGIVPKQQPFDKFAVSVEARFDGTALKAALNADPDGEAGPQRPIPIGWWRDAFEIVGVEMQREKQLSSGDWGEPTVLGAIPARTNLIGEIQKNVKSSGDMPAILEQAKLKAREIVTPEYYTMIAGAPWTAPGETQAVAGGPTGRMEQIQKRLTDLDTEIGRIEKQLALNNERQKRQSDRPGETGPTGKGGGGAGQGTAPQPERRGGPVKETTKATPKTPLEIKQSERERLVAELEELTQKAEKAAAPKVGENANLKSFLDDPKVRVLAHDVAVTPGATYRYRVRVVLNNPLFGREASLPASQKEAAAQSLVRGEWSEWTEPVQVDNDKYYFILSAADRDNFGNSRATADLMEFFYGFYRRASVQLTPGDPILADVKLPADLREFDLVKLAAGMRPKQDAAPEAGVPEAEDRDGKGAGGGRRVAQGQQPAVENKPEVDDVAMPLKHRLESINTGAMLLDVASLPPVTGSKTSQSRVFVRDSNGTIEVKAPEAQGPDSLYQRLLASAKAGENQGRPKVAPRDGKPSDPNQAPGVGPERGKRPTNRDEGGGGGGG